MSQAPANLRVVMHACNPGTKLLEAGGQFMITLSYIDFFSFYLMWLLCIPAWPGIGYVAQAGPETPLPLPRVLGLEVCASIPG